MKRVFSRAAVSATGTIVAVVAIVLVAWPSLAQEPKRVPDNSTRVAVPGCARGRVFTAGAPAEDQPGGTAVPDGMRLRMNGPKSLMADIKRHEGSRIEITGLMKKGQFAPGGVAIGGGVRVGGGPTASGGAMAPMVGGGYPMIDVEGWRSVPGNCPTR